MSGTAVALTISGIAIVGGGVAIYMYEKRQAARRATVAPKIPGVSDVADQIPMTGIGLVDAVSSVLGQAITFYGGKAVAEAGKYAAEGARRYGSIQIGKEQKAS
jgi:hypothetical protein